LYCSDGCVVPTIPESGGAVTGNLRPDQVALDLPIRGFNGHFLNLSHVDSAG
jgi:hypothetical protein